MTPSERDELLREASIAKMKATRLRAFGDADEQWDATVLFRAAAQKELAVIDADPMPSNEELSGALVEACGLFIDAQDPVRATQTWSRMPLFAFTTAAGMATIDRLKEVYYDTMAQFGTAWNALTGLPYPIQEPSSLRRVALSPVLKKFPGVPELWWASAVLARNPDESNLAKARMEQLDPTMKDDAVARTAWKRMCQMLLQTMQIEMHGEKPTSSLDLRFVTTISRALDEILRQFVKNVFGEPLDLLPIGARPGSFILDITAQRLPRLAIVELERELTGVPTRLSIRMLAQILRVLQAKQVTVSLRMRGPNNDGANADEIVIDAPRRKRLLDAIEASPALYKVSSVDIPQADDLERVYHIVELIEKDGALDEASFGLSRRQLAYYRRASIILGLITEDDELTAGGRLIARLDPKDRLRATAVHFESSNCGDAWIRWSEGKNLLDVRPETADQFLRECVPDLSRNTQERRVQTLTAWHRALSEYHYARGR
ncbi:hypothetical protein [Polyangium sorediatum]|uniref:Uncharacterized protein n=1 Tax=Polyangium sorediatum TaxID=889274 RepID=A0ABT6NRT3_9BACT|nr:hypothetical protein [Polyangium sorediatum]MDI1431050.1 hypothetical protein [Polyangium sorediatum]